MEGVAEQAAVGSAAGNLSGGGVAGALNKALSVPTWDGSTPEQRMEMMRDEVRYLRRMVTDAQVTIRNLIRHRHAQDGSIMVPLANRDDEDRPRGYFYDPLK